MFNTHTGNTSINFSLPSNEPYLVTRDYAHSNEVFELLFDKERDLLVTQPQPNKLAPYYDSGTYVSHTDGKKGMINWLYQIVKRYTLRRKLGLISHYLDPNASVLDFGAGTGDFVLAARNRGWQATGVEPNTIAREKANEKGIALNEALEQCNGKKYNMITLWHVLEHLPGLKEQIRDILLHLEEEGTLILALPNFKSWDARYYKSYWAAYDVPRHLWHFSRNSISIIFEDFGFRVIKTKPLIFDAFYIALLSEKYKHGWSNPFRSFLVGLYSNLAARRSGEYSSIIYVLQRT